MDRERVGLCRTVRLHLGLLLLLTNELIVSCRNRLALLTLGVYVTTTLATGRTGRRLVRRVLDHVDEERFLLVVLVRCSVAFLRLSVRFVSSCSIDVRWCQRCSVPLRLCLLLTSQRRFDCRGLLFHGLRRVRDVAESTCLRLTDLLNGIRRSRRRLVVLLTGRNGVNA